MFVFYHRSGPNQAHEGASNPRHFLRLEGCFESQFRLGEFFRFPVADCYFTFVFDVEKSRCSIKSLTASVLSAMKVNKTIWPFASSISVD